MQLPLRRVTVIVSTAMVASLLAFGCGKDSNSVTRPTQFSVPAANISGNWSGSFVSGSALCSNVVVTATLEQNGA
jgi:hypothetical protein